MNEDWDAKFVITLFVTVAVGVTREILRWNERRARRRGELRTRRSDTDVRTRRSDLNMRTRRDDINHGDDHDD